MGNMETTSKYKRHSSLTKPTRAFSVPCTRCGGSGIYHVFGTCFRCGGRGIDPTERDWGFPTDWTDAQCDEFHAKREARNAASRQRAAERRQAEQQATWDANVERWPVLADLFPLDDNASNFVRDIAFTAQKFILTDNQGKALTEAVARDAERAEQRAAEKAAKADIAPWEAGRQVVEGEVKTRDLRHSEYGATWKLRIVTDEGRGLWVTEPSAIDTAVGDRVRMTVTVEPSDDDHTFAFGKRPTKAEVL